MPVVRPGSPDQPGEALLQPRAIREAGHGAVVGAELERALGLAARVELAIELASRLRERACLVVQVEAQGCREQAHEEQAGDIACGYHDHEVQVREESLQRARHEDEHARGEIERGTMEARAVVDHAPHQHPAEDREDEAAHEVVGSAAHRAAVAMNLLAPGQDDGGKRLERGEAQPVRAGPRSSR